MQPAKTHSFQADVFTGDSRPAERLRLQVSRFAPHFRAVLLVGEAYTGKREAARELHRLSPVAHRPFVVVEFPDSGALNPELPAGVLYMPHLERLPLEAQDALLGLLEKLPRDVRVIAGCEVDPRGLLAAGRLRSSLYQHLGMLELRLAPLRERLEDLAALSRAMLARRGLPAFDSASLARLRAHTWPGNLAQLEETCHSYAETGCLQFGPAETSEPTEFRLDSVMHRHVMDVLERCAGNKLRAAEMLGISRSTLYRMLDTAAA